MICIKRKIIDDAAAAIGRLAYLNGTAFMSGYRRDVDITEEVEAIHRLINAADGMTAAGRRRKVPLCP